MIPRLASDAPELSAAFAEHGVVVISGLFSAKKIEQLKTLVEHYRATIAPHLPPQLVRREHDGTIRQMLDIDIAEPRFAAFGRTRPLRSLASVLSNRSVSFASVETFDKPARVGRAGIIHQDAIYLVGRPVELVTLWVPLDPADEENGCMRYWPGSHRTLLPHVPLAGTPGMMRVDPRVEKRLPRPISAPVLPGDAIAHAHRTMHESGPNRSERPRRALSIAYTFLAPRHTAPDPPRLAVSTKRWHSAARR
jgi:phytanoyl-CoA hydroxylase